MLKQAAILIFLFLTLSAPWSIAEESVPPVRLDLREQGFLFYEGDTEDFPQDHLHHRGIFWV